MASPRTIDLAEFYEQLQALEAAAAHNDEGVVRQLAAMIPTFTPTRENLISWPVKPQTSLSISSVREEGFQVMDKPGDAKYGMTEQQMIDSS